MSEFFFENLTLIFDNSNPKRPFIKIKCKFYVAKSPLEYTKFTRWTCVSNADLEGSLYILKGNEMISARNSKLKEYEILSFFFFSEPLFSYFRILVFLYFHTLVFLYSRILCIPAQMFHLHLSQNLSWLFEDQRSLLINSILSIQL